MPGKKVPEKVRREQLLAAAYEVAAREGLGGLTVRAIAAEAEVSHGLVHFHFRTKKQLVGALLDWVLARTLTLPPLESAGQGSRPIERLHALLRSEMNRLSSEPRRMRLFFDYWVLGTRDAAIGARIREELERYRTSLRAVVDEVLRTEPDAFADVTADGLAAVAISFINGCAVQAMIDPDHFDRAEYLTAVQGILGERR
jgi:TetR/AcrR family transcriptional regulator, transcriptional repressor of bet genes